MRLIDLTNQKFTRLKVLERADNLNNQVRWRCICDCGNEVIVRSAALRNGYTKSCGCLSRDRTIKRNKTHGLSKHRLYSIYKNMKQRCYNKNRPDYQRYGGKGVRICKEWLDDFKTFYDWAYENGYSDGLSIDRIDVDGNYEPSNCRWVDDKTQARNRTNNRLVKIDGKVKTVSEWVKLLKLPQSTVRSRISRGWSPKKALITPVKSRGRSHGA